MDKTCNACNAEKPVEDFRPGSKGKCDKCYRSYLREYDRKRWQNPKRRADAKNAILKRKYGIDLKIFDEMLAKQGYVCAVCKLPETKIPHNNGQPWQVDHCHKTGRVRGLLCKHCNFAIGLLSDSPERLSNAIQYLSL